jgi:hypothetical protein
MRPFFALGYPSDTGTYEIDYITLEILTETSEANVLLTSAGGRSVTTIAGTIKSDGVVNTDKVEGDSIAAGEVGGGGDAGKNHIRAGSITATEITAGTITATQITGTTLSAIYADMGTLTAGKIDVGSIEINADTERILFGAATAPLTGVGIFLGKDGTDYEFRAGDPSGDYVHWDGSTFTIKADTFTGSNPTFSGTVEVNNGHADKKIIISEDEVLFSSSLATRSELSIIRNSTDFEISAAGFGGSPPTPKITFAAPAGVFINMTTEDTGFIDAGSTGATEQDWIEVTVGGNTGYIRVYASK